MEGYSQAISQFSVGSALGRGISSWLKNLPSFTILSAILYSPAVIYTAVMLAGLLNFVGALAGTAVAKTIASGFADPSQVDQVVILAALVGASAWNIITWYYGIPSSSSHALIGGLAGGVVAHGGFSAFKWSALGTKVLVPLVVSPIVGFADAWCRSAAASLRRRRSQTT